jgi:GTP-binding protein
VDPDAPLQLLVTMLGYDDYRGVTAIGRIFAGTIKVGQRLARIKWMGRTSLKATLSLYFPGLNKIEIDEVKAGDIVSLAGLGRDRHRRDACRPGKPRRTADHQSGGADRPHDVRREHIPVCRQGRHVGTSRKLRERLNEELRTNVALRVEDTESAENFLVSGRGELHLGILIETMRREGYEFQVSRPEVIFHKADDGALLEPYEEVHIETSNETVGALWWKCLGETRQNDGYAGCGSGDDAHGLHRPHPRLARLPLSVPHIHARRGCHAHHLPRLR